MRISNAENVRIFNEANNYKFQELLNEVSWDEVYEQDDLDLAFTFLEILQIKYNEAFPIVTRNKPKSKINGWFDTELCSLQKKNGLRIYDFYAIIIPNRNRHITKLETIMKESSNEEISILPKTSCFLSK